MNKKQAVKEISRIVRTDGHAQVEYNLKTKSYEVYEPSKNGYYEVYGDNILLKHFTQYVTQKEISQILNYCLRLRLISK